MTDEELIAAFEGAAKSVAEWSCREVSTQAYDEAERAACDELTRHRAAVVSRLAELLDRAEKAEKLVEAATRFEFGEYKADRIMGPIDGSSEFWIVTDESGPGVPKTASCKTSREDAIQLAIELAGKV